jgi:hypothetical protein
MDIRSLIFVKCRYLAASLINPDSIVILKLIRYGAVSYSGDHRSHGGALLYEIFCTDRIEETRSNGDITELDTLAGWFGSHAVLSEKCWKWNLPSLKRGDWVIPVGFREVFCSNAGNLFFWFQKHESPAKTAGLGAGNTV